MKTIILQKNVFMSTKECQNHSVLMAKFYGKYIRLGGYTIINFAIKRENWKKGGYTIWSLLKTYKTIKNGLFWKKRVKIKLLLWPFYLEKKIGR